MRSLLAATSTVIAFVAMAVLAVPAMAHTALESAVPGIGAEVASVDVVTLTFGTELRQGSDPAIRILAPDQTVVAEGRAIIDPSLTSITWDVGIDLPGDGEYVVQWAITAADGDEQSSQYVFTYAGSGSEFVSQLSAEELAALDAASAEDDGASPVVALLVALASAAGAVVLILVARGRLL